jgi:hypothetical protein
MIDKKTAWGAGLVSVFLTGFFAFVNIGEWYTIAIVKNADDYHFGSEGPSPYYFHTSFLYAAVTLTWGIIFLTNLVYLVWSMLKDKRRSTIIGFGMSIILFLTMYMQGQIGAE